MRSGKLWICGLVLTALLGCREPRLVQSIRQGTPAMAQTLIDDGADVNARDSTGLTALCVAIEANDKDTYRRLIAKGANLNLCDSVGTSAMHLAAEHEDIFWLEEALKHGGKHSQPNTGNSVYPNETPIFYAIYKKRRENALALMAAGADLNHVDGNNNTVLYVCMGSGMYDVVMKMIEAGANPVPPKPAFSIFENGRFSKGYEKSIRDPDRQQQYLELKAMLIEKGHLKPAE